MAYIYNINYNLLLACKVLKKIQNILILKILISKPNNNYVCNQQCENLLINWVVTHNIKIKFSGKGYKIIKQSNCFNLSLNTSHPQWFFFFKTISIKIQKQKYLLVNKSIEDLSKVGLSLVKTRMINIYTKRGLRLSKQLVRKKVGKRSS